MSGADSGHDSAGSGPNNPLEAKCDKISFNTVISSLPKQVAKRLAVGDTLSVVLQGNKIQLQTIQGTVAGTFNWARLSKLVDCIEQGHQFVAVIKSIDGGHISIHVSKRV